MKKLVSEKVVNVRTSVPVVNTKYPIVGFVKNITLSVEDILKCILSKAKVEEIIGNRTILLDLINYNTDNSITQDQTQKVIPPTITNVTNEALGMRNQTPQSMQDEITKTDDIVEEKTLAVETKNKSNGKGKK